MTSDLFDRRMPEIFAFISDKHVFPANPTVESLKALRAEVNADFAAAVTERARLVKLWVRAELELSQARGRHVSPPPKRMLELEKAEASTGSEVREFKRTILSLRRAEELMRVLPEAFAGEEEALYWLDIVLARVAKYTPGLPA